MDAATRRWRAALFLFMLAAGTGMASWVARTPAVRDGLDVSTGAMGLVLFGLSTGSMAGVTASGPLVRRHGGRATILGGTVLIVAGLLVVAAGTALPRAAVVFGGLALFGGGMGMSEVAFNIEGAAVETVIGRSVLPVLHGCFSLGTVVGALLGMALTAAALPVGWHLALVAVLIAAAGIRAVLAIPPGTGKETAPAATGREEARGGQLRVWRDRRLVLIGVIVLATAFAEGAANDWLPLLMVDGYDVSATVGSLTFLLFAASMTLGRFVGGPLLERYGRVLAVRLSCVTAALGLAVVIVAPSPVMAGAAAVLWGLGASLGFPVTVSAAGDHPHDAAARVAAVSTAGYFAFLVGPPSLGFLADHIGLRLTMGVVLVLVAVAAALAGALRTEHDAPDVDGEQGPGTHPRTAPGAARDPGTDPDARPAPVTP
ncbi:MFS transporter [Streptomyces sp. NPDC057682]|uniref:MFS transporter n=1 Tax=Streptomyces sp. NPDC057682 TaxID=3346210 RepID=UPI003673D8FC